MRVLVVCGNFGDGERPSSLMSKLFSKYPIPYTMVNGGSIETLKESLASCKDYDIVHWFPNVPNNEVKIRDVKKINPKCMLINSKRNDGGKYTFKELINKSLMVKANLTIEFRKCSNGEYKFMLFDPLGNAWTLPSNSLSSLCEIMYLRTMQLTRYTRQATKPLEEIPVYESNSDFVDIVRTFGDIFQELIQPASDVKRFLGNASFRCVHGFPSYRTDNYIMVSRRNVDKHGILPEDFVPAFLEEGEVFYHGKNKPSVDTPVQLRIYEALPHINFMIHGHVYVSGGIYTDRIIPCGALEEADSILTHLKNYPNIEDGFIINLGGHGCLIGAKSLDYFKGITFKSRPTPEFLGLNDLLGSDDISPEYQILKYKGSTGDNSLWN